MTDLRPNAGRGDKRQQVYELADALLCNAITAEEAQRLSNLVCNNAEARRHYVRFMYDSAMLREWQEDAPATEVGSGRSTTGNRGRSGGRVQGPVAANQQSTIADQQLLSPPIILDLSPAPHSPLFTLHSPVGAFLFSYLMGALLLGIGLLLGLEWRISRDQPVVQSPIRQTPTVAGPVSETPLVARVTGTADCVWTDPKTEVFNRDGVSLGRKFALASGFVELTYDTGAKVILEGPCTYEVESSRGGFLSLGKLTARIDKKAEGGGRRAEREVGGSQWAVGSKSKVQNPKSKIPNPQSLIRNPLFSVRTPTAIVTDLGTEFGVEVDRSGVSRSRVFRGKIELRPIDGDGRSGTSIELKENESATVESDQGRAAQVIRWTPQSPLPAFVRQLPRRTRIKVFNTGQAIREGDSDPHWQLVAATTRPHFKPRPAVVTLVEPRLYLANDPARSQWISMLNGLLNVRNDVTYTFRTTFELVGVPPSAAVLQGRFIADNCVTAIRLNGKATTVPEQASDAPFDKFYSFTINKGFVDGTNVLEIDVYNGSTREQSLKMEYGPMLLRVELNGSVGVER